MIVDYNDLVTNRRVDLTNGYRAHRRVDLTPRSRVPDSSVSPLPNRYQNNRPIGHALSWGVL